MQGPKRYKAITGRPQPRGCVPVCLCAYVPMCAGMLVFMQGQSQNTTLATPFASAAASGRLPLVARGVKILLDLLSKPLPPAVKL